MSLEHVPRMCVMAVMCCPAFPACQEDYRGAFKTSFVCGHTTFKKMCGWQFPVAVSGENSACIATLLHSYSSSVWAFSLVKMPDGLLSLKTVRSREVALWNKWEARSFVLVPRLSCPLPAQVLEQQKNHPVTPCLTVLFFIAICRRIRLAPPQWSLIFSIQVPAALSV
eukprot:GHVT01008200.1.p1 GENE.GHVT01008200.1~~GHVT01008200.1.p1  ORF type:complete len:168 (-),score=0.10 GHVT01008200.1:207-710(-)